MIKLERIYVQNYKNIAEADLELGNMNVIVGENGSGKSNLLSVIPLVNYIINGSMTEIKQAFDNGGSFVEFGYIWNNNLPNNLRKPLIVKIEFSTSEPDVYYSYEINFESVQLQKKLLAGIDFQYSGPNGIDPPEMGFIYLKTRISFEQLTYKLKTKTGKPISVFKRENNEVIFGNGIKKADSINSIDEYTSIIRLLYLIRTSRSINKNYKTVLDSLELVLSSNVYYLSPQTLKHGQANSIDNKRITSYYIEEDMYFLLNIKEFAHLKEPYKNILKNAFDFDDITVHGYRDNNGVANFSTVIIQSGTNKTIFELSDGTIVLLALITKIFSDSSDIFFIEEPENSIHPRALYELMKLIREKSLDKQFIITTHSSYLLNMIKPDEVLVAEIEKNGLSKIVKLPNIKAIKKKLAKSFMSFGDIVFAAAETDDDSE